MQRQRRGHALAVCQADACFPIIGVSTLVGTLVGVLGGPIALVSGAAAGALIVS